MPHYATGGGGGSLRRLQKPCQTEFGIFPRLNVPGGAVADWGDLGASGGHVGDSWKHIGVDLE